MQRVMAGAKRGVDSRLSKKVKRKRVENAVDTSESEEEQGTPDLNRSQNNNQSKERTSKTRTVVTASVVRRSHSRSRSRSRSATPCREEQEKTPPPKKWSHKKGVGKNSTQTGLQPGGSGFEGIPSISPEETLQEADPEMEAMEAASSEINPTALEQAVQKLLDTKIQAAIEAALNKMMSGSTSNSTGRSFEPPEDRDLTECEASDNSGDTTTVFNSSDELQELELMRKMLDCHIAARRAPSQGPPGRKELHFRPILDEAAAGNLSTQVAPPSTLSALSGSVEETRVSKTVEVTSEETKQGDMAHSPAASTSARSGQLGVTPEFKVQVMHVVHDMDGKGALYLHVDEKVMELIAQAKYVDLAKLLKEDEDEDQRLQMVKQDGIMVYVPGTKAPIKIDSLEVWCRAFMTYQSAFNLYFPEKSGQLLEYREYIERVALVFDWQWVYAYDRHFRRVQAAYPDRPWGMVNQDAKDRHLLRCNTDIRARSGGKSESSDVRVKPGADKIKK